jgi:hypothetical protein
MSADRVTRRYHSLDEALTAIDAGMTPGGCRVVVSWAWWDGLSEAERLAYHARCQPLSVKLLTDHRISPHFVEVSSADEPPLSSEYRA